MDIKDELDVASTSSSKQDSWQRQRLGTESKEKKEKAKDKNADDDDEPLAVNIFSNALLQREDFQKVPLVPELHRFRLALHVAEMLSLSLSLSLSSLSPSGKNVLSLSYVSLLLSHSLLLYLASSLLLYLASSLLLYLAMLNRSGVSAFSRRACVWWLWRRRPTSAPSWS